MTQEAMTSETQRPYVSGETATRDSVEDALDHAFASVGGGKMAAPKRLNPVPLSPLMQSIVNILIVDGGWMNGADISAFAGTSSRSVYEAINLQKSRLSSHGLRIESHQKHGYRIVRVET